VVGVVVQRAVDDPAALVLQFHIHRIAAPGEDDQDQDHAEQRAMPPAQAPGYFAVQAHHQDQPQQQQRGSLAAGTASLGHVLRIVRAGELARLGGHGDHRGVGSGTALVVDDGQLDYVLALAQGDVLDLVGGQGLAVFLPDVADDAARRSGG